MKPSWLLRCVRGTKSEEIGDENASLDEVVVEDWLHLERMDDNEWIVRIGDLRVAIDVASGKAVRVDVVRGFYDEVCGETRFWDGKRER